MRKNKFKPNLTQVIPETKSANVAPNFPTKTAAISSSRKEPMDLNIEISSRKMFEPFKKVKH